LPKRVIVAIDGPAGAGKSTVSRRLAHALGYTYIDTGSLYRAIGWKAATSGVTMEEGPELRELCAGIDVSLKSVGGELRVYVDGADVSGLIRTPKISLAASKVSAQPSVRARLLELQRNMGKDGGVVLEGRDIGTVVFPEAEAKFYLDASPEERAKRRYDELTAKGVSADLESTKDEMIKRDRDDSKRAIAPLKKAEGAVVIDTTGLTIDEVVAKMKKIVEAAASSRA